MLIWTTAATLGCFERTFPIVASPETIVIMKGMQDAGISSLETDTAYFSPRQPSDDLGLYLSSVAGMNYQGRDFCCTKEPSEALTGKSKDPQEKVQDTSMNQIISMELASSSPERSRAFVTTASATSRASSWIRKKASADSRIGRGKLKSSFIAPGWIG